MCICGYQLLLFVRVLFIIYGWMHRYNYRNGIGSTLAAVRIRLTALGIRYQARMIGTRFGVCGVPTSCLQRRACARQRLCQSVFCVAPLPQRALVLGGCVCAAGVP